jgi:hypothetical protein
MLIFADFSIQMFHSKEALLLSNSSPLSQCCAAGGSGKTAVSKVKPAAGGAKAKPGAKRPVGRGGKARKDEHAFEDSSSEDDDSSDEDVPLAKRAKA